MKNTNIEHRVIDIYQHSTLRTVSNENGQSFIFTCQSATPETVSDAALQAIKDNCAITIIFPQSSPLGTLGNAFVAGGQPGCGKTPFLREMAQGYVPERPKFDAETVRNGINFCQTSENKK